MVQTHTYVLAAYPKTVTLRNGAFVMIKPMTRNDAAALLGFFRRIPEHERYYFKEDVLDPRVTTRWASELEFDRALPLLAWHEGKVVADGSLHRTRSRARRHVGEIRIVVDPAHRASGLGGRLLRELGDIANEHGLERLSIEAVDMREAELIQLAEKSGFVKAGVLPGHAKDMDGHPRDIVLLELPLGKWLQWWPDPA